MEESLQIKKATGNDLATLRFFEQGIMAAERPFDPTLKPGSHYYDLEAMLTDANTELVIATLQNKAVGCGYARKERSKHYLRHAFHAYLGFMYVLPDYRGHGIIQQILQHLKSWASGNGITELRLEVYCQNTAAVKAYQNAGFQPLMLQMRSHAQKDQEKPTE